MVKKIIAVVMLASLTAHSTTIIATNGYESAVKSAIAQAVAGDTVIIPAGTWVWTSGDVNFSGITLSGAGTNSTYIVDAVTSYGSSPYLFYSTPTTNALSRLTSMTIRDDGAGVQSFKGKVIVDNRGYKAIANWRIDHVVFVNLNGNNIFPYGNNGLIDSCSFYLRGEAVSQYGLSVNPSNPWNTGDPMNDPWGDLPYYDAATYGSSNKALYIESCWFTNLSGPNIAQAAYDGYAGAVSVFRNNYLANCAWYNHGNDTSGRYRSSRMTEIYNNTFVSDNNWVSAMDFRGGSGVVFSNTVTGYKLFNTTENYRSVQPNSFGGADGLNPWDNTNAVTYYTGNTTVTSTTNVVVPGAGWTVNQWYGYMVKDPTAGTIEIGHGAGSVDFALIGGNSSDTLYITPPKDFQIVFTNGDQFKIYFVSNALDQVGVGSGDLIRDVTVGSWPNSVTYTYNTVTGTNSWPRQAAEPIYSWGNKKDGSATELISTYPNIVVGKHIIQATAKPGYIPLSYPHPLAAADSGVIGGGGVGSGPSDGGSGSPTVTTNSLNPLGRVGMIGSMQ